MNRREFFKLAGMGAGALLIAPSVLGSAWTDHWQAQDAVNLAVAQAMAAGASYADARIGRGELVGEVGQAHVALHDGDLLGLRAHIHGHWRMVLIREYSRDCIANAVAEALSAQPTSAAVPRQHWIAATFAEDQVLALHSSDSSQLLHIGREPLRYGKPAHLPPHASNYYFCDLILQQ